jgi:hypothetical protein
LTENPETNTTNKTLCCNPENFAKKRVIYANTNLPKNYYTTTKQYLQNRCKTYQQKAFNFLSYKSLDNSVYHSNPSYISVDGNNKISLRQGGVSGTDAITIAGSGNVGIGTSSPISKLDVVGSGAYARVSDVPGDDGIELGWSSGSSKGYVQAYDRNASAFRDMILNNSLSIQAAGNVGIGTTTPGFKLEVNGSFAATTKSFVIDHPTKPGMKLRYGSLESPYHGVRLTGESSIKEKMCRIDLPEYIGGLCKQEGSQVQVTNKKHGKVLWVEEINIDEN